MSVHRFTVTASPTRVIPAPEVPVNITIEGGGGGGAVDSVNGQTGAVVLDAADVGAATAAQGALADTAVQPGALATVATTGAYGDLSGTPTLGTAAAADTTDFATAAQGTKADTAVQPAALTAAVAAVVDTAPAALDTLNELAAALGDDANFASTVTTALAGKQPLNADLTALAAAGNSAVLAATTAAFTTADETKLDGIEAGADVTDATNVAAAGAVMKTLIDAKGDLLVGTAADTVARLAPGTDGHVLTLDSAQAAGVKWAAAAGGGGGIGNPLGKPSGGASTYMWAHMPAYFAHNPSRGSLSSTTIGADVVRYTPIVIPVDITITALAVRPDGTNVTSEAIIGLFAADSEWQPTGSSLFSQAFDTSTGGWKSVSALSITVSAGRYLKATSMNASRSLESLRTGINIGFAYQAGTMTVGAPYDFRATRTHAAFTTGTAWTTVTTSVDGTLGTHDFWVCQYTI